MLATFVSWLHTYDHPLTGLGYQFWSGIGSDAGEVSILAAMGAIYRKANCHQHRCWRVAHHQYELDGATYNLCRKHHPNAVKRLDVTK